MPEFVFHEPLPEKPKLAFNTPFVIEHLYPPFAMSESLDLHPAAARILDDVRALFSIILQLTAPPSPGELHKVQHTAEMIYGRLESMPDLCPDAPRTPFAPPTVTTAPSEASFPSQSASPSPPPTRSSSTASRESISEQHSTNFSAPSALPVPQSHDPSHITLRDQAHHQHPPDFLYATIRQTALIYARAAATRSPLSAVCPAPQFFLLWSIAFRVPLEEWHRRLGLFLWVIIAVLPTAGLTPIANQPKSLLHIGAVQIAMDHWEVAVEMLRNAVKIVGWLAGGKGV